MTDEQFWAIIARLDWTRSGDDDAVIRPAVRSLAALGAAAIGEFQDALAAKLYQLDTAAHAREIGALAYRGPDDDAFSADAFLYARCVIVANGQALFDHVLRNPRTFPKDVEFEAVLRLAPEAYRRATGEEFDHLTPVSYETFSNKTGWPKPAR